jgi:intracellular sulfur oxidation DsrE/DsrF family protein
MIATEAKIPKEIKSLEATVMEACRISLAAADLPDDSFAEAIRVLPIRDKIDGVISSVKDLERTIARYKRQGRRRADG